MPQQDDLFHHAGFRRKALGLVLQRHFQYHFLHGITPQLKFVGNKKEPTLLASRGVRPLKSALMIHI